LSFLRFLVAWANVPFAIAAGIAILFAALQATGLLGLLAGDHEAEAGGDAEAGHDVGGGHEADADADADADHDADADQDAEANGGVRDFFASSLGFGKIPFSLIWQTYTIVFAATGLALNAHRYWGREPVTASLAWTLPISLLAGYAVVAVLARFLGPVFASEHERATSRAELVGQTGVVISSRVTADFGEVRIHDKTGHDLRVVCKLAEGATAPREHQRVVVVEYSQERGELLVAPLEDDAPEEETKNRA
jgi:membrane protein implicated in regulation of membrane protease activity